MCFQPIIPLFTENIREAFRSVEFGRKFLLRVYAYTKLPLVPVYGGFPVKLVTHVGKPIPYDPNLTPEKLQEKASRDFDYLKGANIGLYFRLPMP